MNYYENIVIIEPTLGDEEIEAASQKIKEVLTKSGGEILKEDRWGRRKLAYELNKRNQGYYILFIYKAQPSSVKKLEDFYRVYDPVFKYMIVKLGKKQISALMEELKESPESEPQESVEGA